MSEESSKKIQTPQPQAATNKADTFRQVLLALLWPPLVLFSVSVVFGLSLGFIGEIFPAVQDYLSDNIFTQLILTALVNLLALIIIIVPFYRFFFKKESRILTSLGLSRAPTIKDVGLTALAFGGYFVTSAFLIGVAESFLPFVNLEQVQDIGLGVPQSSLELFAIFLLLVVAVPILEELIFRGFMFKALRERISFWPTAMLVSVAFGIAHGQWNVGIDTFALSLFLCALREYTGSLWACIFLHAAKNGLAFMFLFVFPDLISGLQ